MMERILFFNNTESRYEALPYFTAGLMKALLDGGVDCELISASHEGNILPLLQKIYRDPPDCTLCFNGLLADSEGHFLADMIEIPHIACLVDSINWFFSLMQSPYHIIACPDKTSCMILESLEFKNWIYMPHGVDSTIQPPPEGQERPYEVVFLGTCIDFQKVRTKWRESQPKKIADAMDAAAEATFANPGLSYQEALLTAFNQSAQTIQNTGIASLLNDLDQYIRGRDRFELIRSITGVPVHIFGGAFESLTWKELLKESDNIIYHDPIPYPEVLDVMKKSKIVLNSSPMFKFGGHERIFTSLACGALSLTNQTAYMLDHFQDGQNVALYRPLHWDESNDTVLNYLSNEPKRKQVAQKGRDLVMQEHTWNRRAADLIRDLGPILAKFS